ncbi:thioredoxin domain-containing protein [Candidatus Nanohaloarchaea archaeon]|nr:thioredoxin domain-containing protein [Candidatus Nanohaloarchaea archaeon]
MSDTLTCEECGREFDSERALHIHQSRAHKEEEDSDNSSEEEDTGEEEGRMKAVFQFNSKKTLYASFLIGVLVGGFLIGGLNALNSQDIGLPSDNNDSGSDRIQFSPSNFSNDPTLGSADAPVRVVMVTDYGCPWCAEWMGVNAIPSRNIDQTQTYQRIKNNYIDTGKVKMTVLDYPAHPNALKMHKAANCVYEQDKSLYGDFSIKLYERREDWLGGRSGADRPVETIRSISQNVGINTTSVLQCVNNTGTTEIQNDVQLVSSKVSKIGTPLFFIGNEENGYVKISGAQTYSTFSKIIDQELQNSN